MIGLNQFMKKKIMMIMFTLSLMVTALNVMATTAYSYKMIEEDNAYFNVIWIVKGIEGVLADAGYVSSLRFNLKTDENWGSDGDFELADGSNLSQTKPEPIVDRGVRAYVVHANVRGDNAEDGCLCYPKLMGSGMGNYYGVRINRGDDRGENYISFDSHYMGSIQSDGSTATWKMFDDYVLNSNVGTFDISTSYETSTQTLIVEYELRPEGHGLVL